MIKKITTVLLSAFILGCVAKPPYRFAVYWQSFVEREYNLKRNKSFWVLKDYIIAKNTPKGEIRIKIPKFTKVKFLRQGSFKKQIRGRVISFLVAEIKIEEKSLLDAPFYKKLSDNIKIKQVLYVAISGSERGFEANFKKVFARYDPVKAFRLSDFEIEKIARKDINEYDREVLLLLTFGEADSVYKEKVGQILYRRYYFKSRKSYYYVLNGVIRRIVKKN